jgi:pyrroline-5-carboxylate reductase
MKRYKLGFIGCGNMGGAMLAGALRSGWANADDVIFHTHTEQTAERMKEEYDVTPAETNAQVAEQARVIVLAVKPVVYDEVLDEIAPHMTDQIIISLAPSWSLADLRQACKSADVRLVRAMPNTPAQVGQGMTGLCWSDNMTDQEKEIIMAFFEGFGRAAVVREACMGAVTAVSGSSPAYVYMMIEAMAEGAIKQGIPAQDAYTFAAQAVYGAAKMVLETGQHPAALRDAVCSAGGTTIKAVAVLESRGFKGALIDAMDACK